MTWHISFNKMRTTVTVIIRSWLSVRQPSHALGHLLGSRMGPRSIRYWSRNQRVMATAPNDVFPKSYGLTISSPHRKTTGKYKKIAKIT